MKCGYSVISFQHKSKIPAGEWKQYQKRWATEQELTEWFRSPVNVGVVCGAISGGLTILDFDSLETYQRFYPDGVEDQTPVVKTGYGVHVLLLSKRSCPSFKLEGLVEVLSEGNCSLMPPSIHPSGAIYEFLNSIREPMVVEDVEAFIRQRASELGYPSREKKKGEKRPQGAPPAAGSLVDGTVFEEIINSKGELVFARSDQPGLYEPSITLSGKTYRPVPAHRVRWNLPPPPIEYEDDLALFNELKQYYWDFVDIKEPGAYDILAAATLASWLLEKWDTVMYLFFLGPRKSGKSTALRIMKQTFYHCTGGPSVTTAALALMTDRYNATIELDEAQLYNSEDRAEALAILRGGYQKDMPRIKVLSTGKGYIDTDQKIFGPKLIAGDTPLEPGIMERCLVFNMAKRSRKLKRLRNPEFKERAIRLRGMLLAYRFHHLSTPVEEELDQLLETKITDDRLQELAYCMLASSPSEARDAIVSFFNKVEESQKAEDQSGEDAEYVRALAMFQDDEAKDADGKRWKDRLKPKGLVLVKDFREALLQVRRESEPAFDPKYLEGHRNMWKILARLGFKPGPHHRDGNTIILDVDRLNELKTRYAPSDHTSV